jgi:hypothetical protein
MSPLSQSGSRWQIFLLYSPCGVAPQNKIKLHYENISLSQNLISHPKPMPTDFSVVSGPRKYKLLTKVATNGDPEVECKRKRLEAKIQSTKPAPTQKKVLNSGSCKNKDHNKGGC